MGDDAARVVIKKILCISICKYHRFVLPLRWKNVILTYEYVWKNVIFEHSNIWKNVMTYA